MFTTFTDSIIDTVQTAKKASLEFVTHKELRTVLSDLVDAQTSQAKNVIKTLTDFNTKLNEIAMDRTPYVEAQKNFEKFFPANAFASSKKSK